MIKVRIHSRCACAGYQGCKYELLHLVKIQYSSRTEEQEGNI